MKYPITALLATTALLAVFVGRQEPSSVLNRPNFGKTERGLPTLSIPLNCPGGSIGERVEEINLPHKGFQGVLQPSVAFVMSSTPDTAAVEQSASAAQNAIQYSTFSTTAGGNTVFSTQPAAKVLSKSEISNSREDQELRVMKAAISEVVQRPTDLPMHAPAVWVEIPDSPHLTQHQQIQIQLDAEKLIQTITEPDSEKDLHHDALAILASDANFRRMYGQQAWMQHHIQAHHLGLIPGKSSNP